MMYIFAVALQDGSWHHIKSYLPQRAARPDTVKLWHKISTQEDPQWTRQYHDPDPHRKSFGAKVVIHFNNSETLEDEIAVADAHPTGVRPFERPQYIGKFDTLTEGLIEASERERFMHLIQELSELKAEKVREINVQLPLDRIQNFEKNRRGIF